MSNLVDVNNMLANISVLAVFKNFLSNEAGVKFVVFLEALKENGDFAQVAELYSDFVSEIYRSEFRGDWSSCIRNFVLTDNNVVSIECAKGNAASIPSFIMGAFEFELRILSDIASVKFEDIREVLMNQFPTYKDTINSLPTFDSYKLLFTKDQIQNSYKQDGYGIISSHCAFKFDSDCELKPITNPDKITFDDLKLYDYQKNILKNNTLAFIKGNKANNILLYGDRGCGKSSSVKAVVNEYKNLGLKIIQLKKENLELIEELSNYLSLFPSKFILFIDDLVFDENDPAFASCKAALEGSIQKHPENVLIYATTNRRHLVKETFSGRQGDQIHLNDTIDETVSLSDRFGITITFSSLDKKNYQEIISKLMAEYGNKQDDDEIFKQAEAFAIMKGSRTPRTARQFLTDYFAQNVN